MKRLAILSTHPIQYNAPLFRMLAADEAIELKVVYSKQLHEVRFDKDFGREVIWDISLTDGYEHESFEASSYAGQKQIVNTIEHFEPDALLVYGGTSESLVDCAYLRDGFRYGFAAIQSYLTHFHFGKSCPKTTADFCLPLSDRAFYVGQANKRYFEWVSLRPDQLTYAPHAVDNEFFMREDETRNELALQKRTELGIPTDATVFLFVGKLEPKKQPNMLAEAFQAAGLCNSHLVFIGSGILETKLKVQCASTENIHFVGFQNQRSMPVWYRV